MKKIGIALLLLIVCSCGRGSILPDGVWTITTSAPPLGKSASLRNLTDCPNGPQMSIGTEGAFDGGSVRDPALWEARGKLWVLYTAALHNKAPYTSVTLGLAYTSDLATGCTGWTKAGQVVQPNPSKGKWNSGAIFSPAVYYDKTTDDTYVYFSSTVSPEQWYSGPSQIGVIHLPPGLDYTVPASYKMPASPLLTAGQAWECSQGVYAPSVVKVGSAYSLYYSSSCTGKNFYVGLATAATPAGPFVKLPQSDNFNYAAPVFSDGHNPTFSDGESEEPSCSVLNSGQVQCFADDPTGSLKAIGFKTFSSSDLAGQSKWSVDIPVIIFRPPPYYSGHLGAMSQVELSSGKWLMVCNGSPSGSPDAVRSLNFLRYTFS